MRKRKPYDIFHTTIARFDEFYSNFWVYIHYNSGHVSPEPKSSDDSQHNYLIVMKELDAGDQIIKSGYGPESLRSFA
ncbi:hypothetical protein BV918_02635 [Pectobacterium odoriferum]|nr:hypothetical protein BV925_02240 [Pectobacterium odoriferum]POE04316.1 hypothetical protein BVY05_02935 [Pectobacterium odoriferum]POE20581.1 hypothetical protein BV918_02635 [Pectobacterium odoriferum]POE23613.1 hypothetical protein BV923_06510 [Pectobacterium odoriferum]